MNGHPDSPQGEFPTLARPDGTLISLRAESKPHLAEVSDWDLGMELLTRLQQPATGWIGDREAWLAAQLGQALRSRFDVHANRFARRRYLDVYGTLYVHSQTKFPIVGATYVDLGCGAVNPLGLLTIFLALGARRGIGVDLDSIQDRGHAARAIADAAAMMTLDPSQIAWDTRIDGAQALRNLDGLDLRGLNRGEFACLHPDRLSFLQNSVYEMAIADAEADVVISNAFLEHVPAVGRGLREIARITRSGGYSVHNIDLTDHRRYGGQTDALEFLTEESDEAILHHCNRLRLSDFVLQFEREGFDVVECRVHHRLPVPAALRERMIPRFRAKELSDIEVGEVVVVARKR